MHGTVSAASLAEQFGVSTRTVERDIASLAEVGLPLYATYGPGGGHGILRHDQAVLLTLTPSEAIGLLITVTSAADAPFADHAAAAVSRLRDGLPGPVRVMADELASKVIVSTPGSSEGLAVRRVVEEAIRSSQVINLDYVDKKGGLTIRPVEAVGLYGGNADWYLVAWCRLRRDRRLFRMDRISGATLTTETFAPRSAVTTLGWVPGHTYPL